MPAFRRATMPEAPEAPHGRRKTMPLVASSREDARALKATKDTHVRTENVSFVALWRRVAKAGRAHRERQRKNMAPIIGKLGSRRDILGKQFWQTTPRRGLAGNGWADVATATYGHFSTSLCQAQQISQCFCSAVQ